MKTKENLCQTGIFGLQTFIIYRINNHFFMRIFFLSINEGQAYLVGLYEGEQRTDLIWNVDLTDDISDDLTLKTISI